MKATFVRSPEQPRAVTRVIFSARHTKGSQVAKPAYVSVPFLQCIDGDFFTAPPPEGRRAPHNPRGERATP